MKFLYKQKLRLGFAISLFLIFSAAIVSHISINNLINDSELVDHTNDVLMKLEKVNTLLTEAQSGQRGFLITGDEEFLEPYKNSYKNTMENYNSLRLLTSDNRSQQFSLDTLKELIETKFSLINKTISLKRRGEDQSSKSILEEKKGKAVMNNTLMLIQKMKKEEQKLLKTRTDNVNFSTLITPMFLIGASLISIIVAVLSFILIERDTNKRL